MNPINKFISELKIQLLIKKELDNFTVWNKIYYLNH